MRDRIVLDPEEIAGLIRGARLLELRVDTPADVRANLLATATTAMDVLAMLDHRELLAFSTLMASELSETSFSGRDVG